MHPTESETKVASAVASLFGQMTFRSARAISHWSTPITIFSSAPELSSLKLSRLKDILGEQPIRELIHRRIDAEGTLHLRFDKQLAAAGEMSLTDGSDCIKISIHTKNYPRNLAQSERDLVSLFL